VYCTKKNLATLVFSSAVIRAIGKTQPQSKNAKIQSLLNQNEMSAHLKKMKYCFRWQRLK
jgi:hypothetical protein